MYLIIHNKQDSRTHLWHAPISISIITNLSNSIAPIYTQLPQLPDTLIQPCFPANHHRQPELHFEFRFLKSQIYVIFQGCYNCQRVPASYKGFFLQTTRSLNYHFLHLFPLNMYLFSFSKISYKVLWSKTAERWCNLLISSHQNTLRNLRPTTIESSLFSLMWEFKSGIPIASTSLLKM